METDRHGRTTAYAPPTTDHIVTYYESCETDYRWLWDLDASLALHLGYWDASTWTLRAALRRMNEAVADRAGVSPGDAVLDAGCGVGGSSVFLAERFQSRVLGLTLSRKQAAAATRNARARRVGHLVRFAVGDYANAPLPSASVNVVWALESACYAASKQRFVLEAFRLLRPGGRLVVADGFATRTPSTDEDATVLRKWLHNWAVPGLETVDNFSRFAREAGFVGVEYDDIMDRVWPSSRRLFLHSLYGLPIGRLAQVIGLRGAVQTANIVGARYQYLACRRGLARYGIFVARKPG